MSKATITLEPLSCPSCLQKIESAVTGLKGIDKDSVKVLFNSGKVKTEFNEEEIEINEIEKAIEDLGYPVIKSKVRSA